MKHLPKHLRPRYRYLAVGIESSPDAEVDRRSFQRELWYSAGNLLGDPGSAAVDLSLLRFEYVDGSGEAIVRTRRGAVESARAAIACISSVDGWAVGVRIRGVSGTVRACEESYLRGAPRAPNETTVAFDGASRDAVCREDAVDVRLSGGYLGATDLDTE